MNFLQEWANAAHTSVGFFWMALWAFALGYLISSLIQVMISRGHMKSLMGDDSAKSMTLGTFFGFISSSCSFAALSTTRALFNKGASFPASMAFLLASTNLVIELGFVIAIFLSWQFVAGEYIGGVLLIAFAWLYIKLTSPTGLIKSARKNENAEDEDNSTKPWSALLTRETWQQVAKKYQMEWQMVWQDVLLGFTAAGIISAFVPSEFFNWLFQGSGANVADASFLEVLQQTIVGPLAAFFTFIGSMGNIPLAAVLYGEGVAFAGVMAFIFSDLIVLPVLRINAKYYGWKMALYIALMLFVCLVLTALTLHYGLFAFDALPDHSQQQKITERAFFSVDYGFILNLIFLAVSAGLIYLTQRQKKQHNHHEHHHHHDHDHGSSNSWRDYLMNGLCIIAGVWLIAGLILYGTL